MRANTTSQKIAGNLEQVFATSGFAELRVDALREAAGVSSETLNKYYSSRRKMVMAALEYRDQRYLQEIFMPLEATVERALPQILDSMGEWMQRNAPTCCAISQRSGGIS